MYSSFLVIAFVVTVLFSVGNSTSSDELKKLTAGDPSKFRAESTIHFNATSEEMGSWVLYKQCDSRWANQELGYCASLTICSAGCAMSSVAMMLKTKGANVDPASSDVYLTQHGGYANGCDIIWSKADDFGVTKFQGIQYANEQEICNGLSQMHGIIANVNNGGHWVLLTGCAGGGVFYVNDPGYSRTTYKMSEILMEAVYH